MFGGCIADRVIVNGEEIALANVRRFANVQFSPDSVCRYVDQKYDFLAHCWYQKFTCNVPFPKTRETMQN